MANNHRFQAIQQLRELILCGTLRPWPARHRGGLGRAPGHFAHPDPSGPAGVMQEGLLVQAGNRGYAVRRFSQRESLDALTVRALMEGMGARTVAEEGASEE